jgi:hypothetical protein
MDIKHAQVGPCQTLRARQGTAMQQSAAYLESVVTQPVQQVDHLRISICLHTSIVISHLKAGQAVGHKPAPILLVRCFYLSRHCGLRNRGCLWVASLHNVP